MFSACGKNDEPKGFYLTEKMEYDDIDVIVDSVSETTYSVPSTGENGYTIKVIFTLKNNKTKEFSVDDDCFDIRTEDKNQKYKTEQILFYRTIIAGGQETYWLEFKVPYSMSEKNYIMYFDWGLLHKEQAYHLYYRNSTGTGETYSLTVASLTNGEILLPKQNARSGETLTITVNPKIGYQLANNTFYINGQAYTNTTFIMPNENIVITAEFELTAEASKFSGSSQISIQPKFYTSSKNLHIKATNNSSTTITAVKYLIVPLDAYGNNIKRYGNGVIQLTATHNDSINAGSYGTNAWTVSGFTGISNVRVYVYSVRFSNGTEWGSSTASPELAKAFGSSWSATMV